RQLQPGIGVILGNDESQSYIVNRCCKIVTLSRHSLEAICVVVVEGLEQATAAKETTYSPETRVRPGRKTPSVLAFASYFHTFDMVKANLFRGHALRRRCFCR